MNKEELKNRTKTFALSIIKLIDKVPNTVSGNVIAKQIVRSATSVGANYRAACRVKSNKDFLYKILIIEEEADETCYWLELLKESLMVNQELLNPLLKESNELTAIFTATGKTLHSNINSKKSEIKNHKSEIINHKSEIIK